MLGVQGLPSPVVRDAFRIARRELTAEELRTLGEFGRFAREELEPVAYEVDRRSPPRLLESDPDGGRPPEVVLSADHRRVLDRMYASGLAVGPLGLRHDWPFTFALMHEVADVGCLCSATVTLATVYSIDKWAPPEVRDRFLPALLEAGGRAQGATWATEEQGGSDLGSNLSRARPVSGHRWALSGEKFFCSNVGASCAVVTARPEGGADGIRGVRLFFVPAVREGGGANWRVRRLKEKLGTVAVPTGEVVFEDSEAYALGTTEVGVLPVMEMLNVSRVANAVGSAAVLQRAFEAAATYAQQRSAFGKTIAGHPLLSLDLATLATEADAASLLALDSAFRFARSARDRPPYTAEFQLTRFTTHVAKLVTAEQAVRGTALAMEILGGIGYLEERPVAKLVRDALVTPIWEGGANIQSIDAREVARRHHPEARWEAAAGRAASQTSSPNIHRFLSERLDALGRSTEEIDAKRTVRMWGEVRQVTLMVVRGRKSPDSEVSDARAELFVQLRSDRPTGGISTELVETALGSDLGPHEIAPHAGSVPT